MTARALDPRACVSSFRAAMEKLENVLAVRAKLGPAKSDKKGKTRALTRMDSGDKMEPTSGLEPLTCRLRKAVCSFIFKHFDVFSSSLAHL